MIHRQTAFALAALVLSSCGASRSGLGDAGGDAAAIKAALADQLVGAWSFDVDGADHSGHKLDLGVTGLRFGAGHFGKGIVFAGDYTPIAQRPINDPSLDLVTGDFTVSFWINFTKTGTPQFVAIKGYDPSGWWVGWAQTEWAYRLAPAGKTFPDPATTPKTGTFHHVVLERTAGTVEMFVDEASVGTDTVADGKPATDPFQVGGFAAGGVTVAQGQKVVNGTVDDLGIWRRALTADERAYLATHPVP